MSEKLLQRRFGSAASAVKFVLTVLAHADTLADVRTFRSIQIVPLPPAEELSGRLLIRHREIDMTTETLTHDTDAVCHPDRDTSGWQTHVRSLRIISINTNAA